MTWNEDCQNEIDRILADKDLSEVITFAVGQIVDGHLGRFALQLNVYNGGCDPAQIQDFGERLLCAAVDKIRENAVDGPHQPVAAADLPQEKTRPATRLHLIVRGFLGCNVQVKVDEIKFSIGEDGEVSLCVGPFSVEVCETADDFPDFVEAMMHKLRNIEDEFKANGYMTE